MTKRCRWRMRGDQRRCSVRVRISFRRRTLLIPYLDYGASIARQSRLAVVRHFQDHVQRPGFFRHRSLARLELRNRDRCFRAIRAVDRDKILERAVERGLVEPGVVLTDAEVYELSYQERPTVRRP